MEGSRPKTGREVTGRKKMSKATRTKNHHHVVKNLKMMFVVNLNVKQLIMEGAPQKYGKR